MDIKKAVKVACAMKGISFSALERELYPDSQGHLHHLLNPNRAINGPRIGLIADIAERLDLKASELVKLAE